MRSVTYTCFSGDGSFKIWRAIYNDNAPPFGDPETQNPDVTRRTLGSAIVGCDIW